MTTAIVAFGANLGRPASLFEEVRQRLSCKSGIATVRASRLYRTTPVGGPSNQPAYVNGAYEVAGSFDPDRLLPILQQWQREAGRTSTDRWQPRPLDLDIVWCDSPTILVTPSLTIPHPRMHYRWFVLRPICDLRPDAIHPVLGHTMRELLARIEGEPLRIGVACSTETDFEQVRGCLEGMDSRLECERVRQPFTCVRHGDSVVGACWKGETPPHWVFVLNESVLEPGAAEGDIVPALDLRSGWETTVRLFADSIKPGVFIDPEFQQ